MTEPTDVELAVLRSEFGITSNGRGIKEYTQVRDFARDVLAKWGTPAPVGVEPAEFSQFLSDVMTAAGLVTHGKQCKDLGVRLGDMCSRLRADQALAMVPLTDEWIRSRCKEPWIFETAKQWVRMAEEAHGIKQGGQRGTE